MEKNKYYTPKISELVVGLEVEFDYPEKPFRLNYTIRRASMLYSDENGKSNIYDIANGNPLVKYLDEEDIISLGFIKEGNHFFFKNTAKEYRKKDENVFKLTFLEKPFNVKTIVLSYLIDGTRVLFSGNIKNKLELKKILKQTSVL
jgi:hypothetical protein